LRLSQITHSSWATQINDAQNYSVLCLVFIGRYLHSCSTRLFGLLTSFRFVWFAKKVVKVIANLIWQALTKFSWKHKSYACSKNMCWQCACNYSRVCNVHNRCVRRCSMPRTTKEIFSTLAWMSVGLSLACRDVQVHAHLRLGSFRSSVQLQAAPRGMRKTNFTQRQMRCQRHESNASWK
jgi:hypothetical protein